MENQMNDLMVNNLVLVGKLTAVNVSEGKSRICLDVNGSEFTIFFNDEQPNTKKIPLNSTVGVNAYLTLHVGERLYFDNTKQVKINGRKLSLITTNQESDV